MSNKTKVRVNTARLKYAREHYALTLSNVEETCKIRSDKLEKFETGEDSPTYSQLSELSNYYNRPMLFFFFCDAPPEEHIAVDFRSVSGQTGEELGRSTRILIERANLHRLNIRTVSTNRKEPSPQFRQMLSEADALDDNGLFTWLREKLDLPLSEQKKYGSSAELIEYLREKMYGIGVYIFKDSFRDDTISALSLYDDEFPVILLNNKTTFSRQLFSMFHELYHLWHGNHNIFSSRGIEKECDEFASRFLIPDNDLELDIKNLVNIGHSDIEALANEYNVSLEAMAYRLYLRKNIEKELYLSIREERKYIRKKNAEASGGNFYYTRISYLGRPYLREVFKYYHAGQLKISDVAKLTNLKVMQVSKLSSKFWGADF